MGDFISSLWAIHCFYISSDVASVAFKTQLIIDCINVTTVVYLFRNVFFFLLIMFVLLSQTICILIKWAMTMCGIIVPHNFWSFSLCCFCVLPTLNFIAMCMRLSSAILMTCGPSCACSSVLFLGKVLKMYWGLNIFKTVSWWKGFSCRYHDNHNILIWLY